MFARKCVYIAQTNGQIHLQVAGLCANLLIRTQMPSHCHWARPSLIETTVIILTLFAQVMVSKASATNYDVKIHHWGLKG